MTKSKKPNRGEEVNFASLNKFKLQEDGQRICNVTARFGVETEEVKQRKKEERAKIEKLFSKIKASPHSDGWIRLCEILEDAKVDKRIMSSSAASEFLDHLIWWVGGSVTTSSADEALESLASEVISANAKAMSDKSRLPNTEMKAWIVEEWAACKAKKQSKRNFAQVYVPKLLEKFGETVKERTISGEWLKKL